MIIRTVLVFFIYLLLISAQAIYTAANADSPSQLASEAASSQNHFIPGTAIYGNNFGLDEANRLAKNGVYIGKDSRSNYIDLAFGNILLDPDKDIVVGTHAADIHIPADATVFVIESSTGLIVYDLGQPESKEVSIVAGRYKFIMQPGRMFALSAQNVDSFAQTDLSCRSIPYSNAEKLDLHGLSIEAFVADFSMPSAVITIEPLKRLAISSNSEDKALLQKIARTTTIIEQNIAAGKRRPVSKP